MSTYFNKEWLKLEQFKDWLVADNDTKFAMCRVCSHPKNRFALSNMGERALTSHMKGKKHIQCLASYKDNSQQKLNNFFQRPQSVLDNSSTVDDPERSIVMPSRPSSSIEAFTFDDKSVTNAEIIWTIKNVYSNFSLKSSESLPNLFRSMFPDSVIARNFTFSKDKCSYYINYGLGPYYKSVLVNDIQASPYYSTSFDESLNRVTQLEQMDIYVTFWNLTAKRVESRYYETEFMGHTTAKDLQNSFNKKMEKFSASKLIQVGMDGPNVNWSFYDKLNEERKELTLPELLHTGSCGLHILHGAFKTGENATEWKLAKTLKALHKIFDESPARRADYTELTGQC